MSNTVSARIGLPAAWTLVATLGALTIASPAEARPRLGVLVIFDQLRSQDLDRYASFFGPGGFGGLDGARLDAWYGYPGTETGPGHATLATGANPDVHGIAANSWFVGRARQYAVDDPAFPVLGSTDGSGRSAAALVAPTLADVLKAESGGRGRALALSLKDRAALLSAGRGADLAVWYDRTLGRFTSSKAYVDELPTWLAEKGASLPAAARATARWEALPIPRGLESLVPPDDRRGEAAARGLTRTFPHDLAGQPEDLQRALYPLMPQAMDDLFALALDAMDAFELGRDEEPDLLVVSVSSTDYVGHNFGPDSLEQLDLLRRADLSLRRFLTAVEQRVTPRSLVVAVSSDHGAPPLPLAAEGARWPNRIVGVDEVAGTAEAAAARAAGPKAERKKRVLGFLPPQLFVDTTDLSPEVARQVLEEVAHDVQGIPGIARVYDFSRFDKDDDAWAPLMRASAFPGRSAPLFVRQAPRAVFLESKEKLGTDHGAPYAYDRRVPLLLAGPGVRRGRYAVPVDVRDVAPTLAFLLGISPPDMCQGKPVPAVGD